MVNDINRLLKAYLNFCKAFRNKGLREPVEEEADVSHRSFPEITSLCDVMFWGLDIKKWLLKKNSDGDLG